VSRHVSPGIDRDKPELEVEPLQDVTGCAARGAKPVSREADEPLGAVVVQCTVRERRAPRPRVDDLGADESGHRPDAATHVLGRAAAAPVHEASEGGSGSRGTGHHVPYSH
jgi:hypothetical protein